MDEYPLIISISSSNPITLFHILIQSNILLDIQWISARIIPIGYLLDILIRLVN
jgi:hypothetical protein